MSLERELDSFIGTEEYHRHDIGPLLLTDGAKYLANKANCYWLISAIGSYQGDLVEGKLTPGKRRLRDFPILFWTLEVAEDKSAILTCVEDTGYTPLIVQAFKYTDFPLKRITLYLQRGVLMLPSEY